MYFLKLLKKNANVFKANIYLYVVPYALVWSFLLKHTNPIKILKIL
jgi:hypothetical protein